MRTKTPTKTTGNVTDRVLSRIQSSNLKVYDQDQGKMIVETKKKKLACDSCLIQDRKFIPASQVNKNKTLHINQSVKDILQYGVQQQHTLSYCELEPIVVQHNGRYEALRMDHSELVQKALLVYRKREEFSKQIHQILFTIEQTIRNSNTLSNSLREQTVPNHNQWEQLQQQHQSVIATCVAWLSDQMFDENILNLEDQQRLQLYEQDRVITQLKLRVQHQNVMLQKIQHSISEPMLGMAGLLKQVGQLKSRIEDLNSIVECKDKEISQQQQELNSIHTILERATSIIKKYPTLFREQTATNVINLKEFQYDLEMIYLNYGQYKQSQKQIQQLQQQYDDLNKQMQDQHIEHENQMKISNQSALVKDPKLRNLIDDLSRIILSKDPTGMNRDLRDLIKEIYIVNHKEIIEDQEKQIELLKNQVSKLGMENNRLSSYGRDSLLVQKPTFDEEEYLHSIQAQALALERCVLLK